MRIVMLKRTFEKNGSAFKEGQYYKVDEFSNRELVWVVWVSKGLGISFMDTKEFYDRFEPLSEEQKYE